MAPPRPGAPRPAAKPLARSYTPLKLEVQRGAKELVVDDFVDTYFRERPKTIRGPRLDELPLPPAEPAPAPHPPVDEESGIRALGATRDEIELSIAEHEEDIIALEARLADRDEQVESMQGEMLRLQGELEALRRKRTASSRPPGGERSPAPSPVEGRHAAHPAPQTQPVYPYAVAPDDPMTERMPRKRGAAWGIALVGLAVAAAATVAVLWPRSPADAPSASTSSTPSGSASPVGPAAEPDPTAGADPSTRPSSVAQPTASTPAPAADAATQAASPEPGAPAAAAPAGALPPASDVEAEGLLSFQARLTVHSDIDAEVVVQGQPAGRTNQELLVRCGPRNVRIRDDRGWRSAGQHVRITCMHAVTVPIPATP